MISWLARPVRSLRDTLELGDAPQQLALGVALGMVIGLVPKGNLLCVGLCLTAIGTRTNLGTTMLSAVLFSLVSPLADPLTHRIGLTLLTWEMLQPAFELLYDVPLAAWTAFNNTVVLGSLSLGAVAFLPVYWLAKLCFEVSAAPAAAAARAARTTPAARRIDTSETLAPHLGDAAWGRKSPSGDEPSLSAEAPEQPPLEAEPSSDAVAAALRIEAAHPRPAPVAPAKYDSGSDPVQSH